MDGISGWYKWMVETFNGIYPYKSTINFFHISGSIGIYGKKLRELIWFLIDPNGIYGIYPMDHLMVSMGSMGPHP